MKIGLADLGRQHFFREYLSRLDGRAVLEHYGAEACTESHEMDGTTGITHRCLLDRVEPHHSNGDAVPSAYCNIDKKLYTCYSSGWGGSLLHLIAKMERQDSVTDTLPVVGQFLRGAVASEEDLTAKIRAMFAEQGEMAFDPPSYGEQVLRPWSFVHPYLYEERGITVEAAQKLQLGFDESENRIVFPHFWDDGKLVGWQKRAIPARPGWPGTVPEYPKYRNSIGFPKAETLYRYPYVPSRAVVVVESPMSVAKAVSLGLDSVVATFGAKVTPHQIELLRSFDAVWVWFDADPAGYAGERKLVEGLHRHVEVNVVVPEAGRDLGDYTSLDEVMGTLSRSVPAVLRRAQYGGG